MSDNTNDTNVIGTLSDAAKKLYDELLTTGSSVMLDDVVKIMVTNTEKYAGWSGELQQKPIDSANTERLLLSINENTVLGVDDWIIIEPVVRAHCDLVQARRMEGAQGLGVQVTGMTSSEALQLYKDAIAIMQKEAFQCQPFTVETPQSNARDILKVSHIFDESIYNSRS